MKPGKGWKKVREDRHVELYKQALAERDAAAERERGLREALEKIKALPCHCEETRTCPWHIATTALSQPSPAPEDRANGPWNWLRSRLSVEDFQRLSRQVGDSIIRNRAEVREKSEAQASRMAAVVEAAKEYLDNGGMQHVWNCSISKSPIGSKPCDCGNDVLYAALADLPALDQDAGKP